MLKRLLTRMKNRSKGTSFQKIWLKMILVAVLTVMLPILVLGIWFCSNWENSQLDRFRQESENRLRNIALTIQQNLHMVDNDVLLMKQSSAFTDFKLMTKPGEHVEELQAVHARLSEICTKYAFVQSVYFYDARCNAFVTNIYGSYTHDEFYDREWLREMDSSYLVRRLDVRLNVDEEIRKDPIRLRRVVYQPEYVLTVAGTGVNSIRVAVNVGVQALYEYLDGIYTFTEGEFSVIDRQGRLVMGSDTAAIGKTISGLEDFNGELHGLLDGLDTETGLLPDDGTTDGFVRTADRFLFIHPMQDNTLACILSFPAEQLEEANAVFRTYIFIVCLLVALSVILVSLYVTRRIYSPVTELFLSIRSLPRPGGKTDEAQIRDEMSYIKGLYDDLSNNREDMQTRLSGYELALRNHVFRDFLDGVSSYERMIGMIGPDCIDFESRPGRFIVFRIPHASPETCTPTARVQVSELINAYIANSAQGLFFDIESDLFLAFLATEREIDLVPVAAMVKRLFGEILDVPVCAGQSGVTRSARDLTGAYQQAMAACRHAVFFGLEDGFIDSRTLKRCQKFDFSFVINFETDIIRSILFMDDKAAEEGIRSLRAHILQTPDSDFARSVLLRLLTTLEKEFGLNALIDGDVFERFYPLDSLQAMVDYIRDLVARTISHMDRNRESQQDYCTRAKAFLESNYRDKDLSVCNISDELGISYPYLSKIFKDATGTGLLDYLNAIRIEKGKEALLQTSGNLGAVSEMVGYNNSQSFQRFFKKIVGVTPGEYRKACGKE